VDWLWPDLLLLLALIPLVVFAYISIMRRRYTARYSSLSLVREALPNCSWLRRHLPSLLFLFALTSGMLAMARPILPRNVLSSRTTIMLTLDISRSMCMRDVQPTRLEVAKNAARSFVKHPVIGTQVGVVAFAGFAELAQRPTTDVHMLDVSIENLVTATNTAIGSEILRALDAIAEVDARVAKSTAIDEAADDTSAPTAALPSTRRSYLPHIIVLLTDGASNAGPSPILAAGQAADRGIRIYTIGFGTAHSAIMDCRDRPLQDSAPDPLAPRSGSRSSGTEPDDATLRQIADLTGGEFYAATSTGELQQVFQSLHEYVAQTNETAEISVYLAAFAAILVMTAFIISLFWHPFL
jgi:Ca-activated chloride channel homolog